MSKDLDNLKEIRDFILTFCTEVNFKGIDRVVKGEDTTGLYLQYNFLCFFFNSTNPHTLVYKYSLNSKPLSINIREAVYQPLQNISEIETHSIYKNYLSDFNIAEDLFFRRVKFL